MDKVTQVCPQRSSPPGMAPQGHSTGHLPGPTCRVEQDPEAWEEAWLSLAWSRGGTLGESLLFWGRGSRP